VWKKGGRGGDIKKEEDWPDSSNAADAALQIVSSLLDNGDDAVRGKEQEDEKNGGARIKASGQKRAFTMTLIMTCLAFLLFTIDLIISLVSNLVQNDRVWSFLHAWVEKNKTDYKSSD